MASLPDPTNSTWQYGKKTDWYTKEQLIAYGKACDAEAQVRAATECISLSRELALYRERERTMGWAQD